MAKKIPVDVEVTNHLSIFTFTLLTEAARGWVRENVQQDATYFAGQLVVEHRYAWDLAQGMQNDGLVLR